MKKAKKPKKTRRMWIAVELIIAKQLRGFMTSLCYRTRREVIEQGYGHPNYSIIPIDVPVTK